MNQYPYPGYPGWPPQGGQPSPGVQAPQAPSAPFPAAGAPSGPQVPGNWAQPGAPVPGQAPWGPAYPPQPPAPWQGGFPAQAPLAPPAPVQAQVPPVQLPVAQVRQPVVPVQPQVPPMQPPAAPVQPPFAYEYPAPAQPAPPVGAPPPAAYPAPPAFALGHRGNPRVKGASRTLNRLCLCVIAQTAASLFWSFLFALVSTFNGVNILADDVAYLWLSAALVPLSTALPFVVYLLAGRKDPVQYLRFQRTGPLLGVLCVLAGLAVCILGNYPAFFLRDILDNFGYQPVDSTPYLGGGNAWTALWVELFSTAILVPVMEEFAFRGVLFSALRRHGTGFAVVVSALVFSLVHLDISNVLFAFVAGLVFGYLYARTNNLWVSIAIHALNNGIAVLTGYLDLFVPEQYLDLAGTLFLLVPVILGLAALVVLLVFRRRLFPPRPWQETPCPLRAGEAAQSTVRAPLFWATVALMVWYTATLFL